MAGDMLARFASSGSSFSYDDGLWGGGTGTVDGDVSYASDFWGHGNGAGSDSTKCLDVFLGSSLPSGFYVHRNVMYIGSGDLLLAVSLTVVVRLRLEECFCANHLACSFVGCK